MKSQQINNYFKVTMRCLIQFAVVLSVIVGAITVVAIFTPMSVAATDWNDNDVSEQICKEEQRRRAKELWIAENGSYQSDLSKSAEREALAYSVQKQKELNHAKNSTENSL